MGRALGRVLLVTSVAAVVASVGGCMPFVHDPDYPKGWSALAASVGADCTGLSGTFANQGVTTRMWHPIGERRLSSWVCGAADPAGRGARPPACEANAPVTRVRLIVDGAHVSAELLDDDNHATHLELSPALTTRCEGEHLTVKGTFLPRCGACVVISHGFASLYRSLDESLVLHDGETSAGSVLLVLNAAGYEADWARFAAIAPARTADLEPWPQSSRPWSVHATWFGGPEGAEVLLWHPIRPPLDGTLTVAEQKLEFRPYRIEGWQLPYREIRDVATETPASNAETHGSGAGDRPAPPSLLHPPERPVPTLVVRLTLGNGRSVAFDAGSTDRTNEAADRIRAHLAREAPPVPTAQPSGER